VACSLATSRSSAEARAQHASQDTAPAPPVEHVRGGVIAGVGFPHPLSVEGLVQLERFVAIGGEYGVLPTTTVQQLHTSMWSLAADVRIFPFRGAFFAGLRAGVQHLHEAATVTIGPLGTFSGTQDVDTTFLNPRLGFLWSFGPIAFGVEAGVQIPIAWSTSTNVPAQITPPQPVVILTHTLGMDVIPTVDLMRLGIIL
jgi:hypothetical protein